MHIRHRNGNAEIVRHATWMKKEVCRSCSRPTTPWPWRRRPLTPSTPLPKSERQGQILRPRRCQDRRRIQGCRSQPGERNRQQRLP